MVPKVAGGGASFKGAGLYYLHDKKADTNARVALTQTLNLATDNPEMALKFMAHTALRQDALKARSGVPPTGRKLTKPVYAYSLSWAPDEQPTHAEMVEAAKETLKVLGVDQHEALMVIHTDEPHPHIHVILNRVHPETGLAAKMSNDHLELSKWAENYERTHGKIRCEERVINNEERRKRKARGENGFVKHKQKTNTADHRRLEAANDRWTEDSALTLDLSVPSHVRQRQALYDHKEKRIAERRLQIRTQNKPTWSALYKAQEREAKDLHQAQKGAFSRLLHWIRHRKELPTRGGLLRGALEAVLGRHDFAKELWKKHERQRNELADRIGKQSRAVIDQENAAYRRDLDHMRKEQAAELAATREAQQPERDGFHLPGPPPLPEEFRKRDAEEYRKQEEDHKRDAKAEKPMREEFTDRVRKRIRRARKKREDRGKGHGRERE